MHSRLTAILFAISAAMCPAGAFGQNSSSVSTGPNGFSGSAHFGSAVPFQMRAVTGAPYSGEEVMEQVQTLADGTHITRKEPSRKVFRDSLGRTRTERQLFPGMAMAGRVPDSPLVVEITDPVAQVKYTLDTVNKVAHRQRLQTPAARVAKVAGVSGSGAGMGIGQGTGGVMGQMTFSGAGQPSDRIRPQSATEKLGTQTIEGVLAEGTRHTTTWPIDSQGNDRPISVVSETWMSPDLKVMILNKSNDPRSGEHTQRLTNISLGEPSASLFQPPADYTVADETGDFTIKFGSQQ